ncbi:MAG: carboxypeptidase regulatory-like domain-containing protein [Anaerolineales bacterium]|nr:MAG: carboxypeptidase regulatory-like domain-containing protein [Anaerolineales bacterium]
MKTSIPVRVLLLAVMLVSALGTSTQAFAKSEAAPFLPAQIIIRSTTFWDATFSGTVNADRFERWSLQIEEASSFSVTVTALTGDLVPSIYLLDSGENEIASAAGVPSETVLTTTQPAGEFFIQIQPASGGGTYSMVIRKTDAPVVDPNAVIVLNPASIDIGDVSTATVMLNNVPEGGYASAEFTCSYDVAFVEVSNISEAGLFGSDSAVVLNGPQDGSFIIAIAGSNGQRAMSSGAAFTFSVLGLQAGQTTITCQVRVSTGNSLTTLDPVSVTLTIAEPEGTITGTVLASKPVTVTLYNQDSSVAATTTADENGNFSMTAPPGSYTIVASALGFLKAQGSPTVTGGGTTVMQTIQLLAGDIDGNDVIDQFDAMTIGFNYGLSTPDAADLNNDGIIDVLDLELLAANYRQAGALNWQ